jgi:hypothetical protein
MEACLPDTRPDDEARAREVLIGHGDFWRWPFTVLLGTLDGPSLWSQRQRLERREAYRITHLGGWGGGSTTLIVHEAESARIERRATTDCVLPGDVAARETILYPTLHAPEAAWRDLAGCMQTRFWSQADRDERSGVDGSTTMLEAVREGRYRVLVRWNEEYVSECVWAFVTEARRAAGETP